MTKEGNMTSQRLTRSCVAGQPLEEQHVEFRTLDGAIYRLTHYDVIDGRVLWMHGYRESDGVRFYTSRTPDELTAQSLKGLDGRD